jgi:putative transposase
MPKLKRVRHGHDEEWQQLELRLIFPEQRVYELIRPVVLYGLSPAERARETGAAERTIYRQVERFRQSGICAFCPPDTPQPPNRLPPDIKALILDLKAEHPPLRVNEIATICYARTGRRPDDRTIKRVLAENPLPERTARRFPPYHQIPLKGFHLAKGGELDGILWYDHACQALISQRRRHAHLQLV